MKYKAVLLICVIIILILQILIVAQLSTNPTQPTITQQKMHCLELGSNLRYQQCLKLIQ